MYVLLVSFMPRLDSSCVPVTVLHELHLIHTDLKPENILLVNNDYQVVQVPTSSKVSKGDISGVSMS